MLATELVGTQWPIPLQQLSAIVAKEIGTQRAYGYGAPLVRVDMKMRNQEGMIMATAVADEELPLKTSLADRSIG